MAFLTEMLVNGISNLFSSAAEETMSQIPAPAFEYAMSTMADAPVVQTVAEQVVANLTNATVVEAAEQVVANLTNTTAEAAAEAVSQTWGEFAYDWAAWGIGSLVGGAAAGGYAYLRNRGGNEKPMTQAEFQTLMGYDAEQMKGIDAKAYDFAKAIQSLFCQAAFEELKKSQALLATFKQPKTLAAITKDEELTTMCMQFLSDNVKHAQKALNNMSKEARARVKGFSDLALEQFVASANKYVKRDGKDGDQKNYQMLPKLSAEQQMKFLDAVEVYASKKMAPKMAPKAK